MVLNRLDNPHVFNVTVLRRETVMVPAGTFDCFVVEIRQRSVSGDYESRLQNWYAPDHGFVVKRVVELIQGAPASTPPGWELARIERGR